MGFGDAIGALVNAKTAESQRLYTNQRSDEQMLADRFLKEAQVAAQQRRDTADIEYNRRMADNQDIMTQGERAKTDQTIQMNNTNSGLASMKDAYDMYQALAAQMKSGKIPADADALATQWEQFRHLSIAYNKGLDPGASPALDLKVEPDMEKLAAMQQLYSRRPTDVNTPEGQAILAETQASAHASPGLAGAAVSPGQTAEELANTNMQDKQLGAQVEQMHLSAKSEANKQIAVFYQLPGFLGMSYQKKYNLVYNQLLNIYNPVQADEIAQAVASAKDIPSADNKLQSSTTIESQKIGANAQIRSAQIAANARGGDGSGQGYGSVNETLSPEKVKGLMTDIFTKRGQLMNTGKTEFSPGEMEVLRTGMAQSMSMLTRLPYDVTDYVTRADPSGNNWKAAYSALKQYTGPGGQGFTDAEIRMIHQKMMYTGEAIIPASPGASAPTQGTGGSWLQKTLPKALEGIGMLGYPTAASAMNHVGPAPVTIHTDGGANYGSVKVKKRAKPTHAKANPAVIITGTKKVQAKIKGKNAQNNSK